MHEDADGYARSWSAMKHEPRPAPSDKPPSKPHPDCRGGPRESGLRVGCRCGPPGRPSGYGSISLSSRRSLGLAVAAASPALAASQDVYLAHWGRIGLRSWHGRAADRATDVDIKQAGERDGSYLIAVKTERRGQGEATTLIADSRSCSALAQLPTAVTKLQPIVMGKHTPLVEPDPDQPGWMIAHVSMDGPTFTVEAPFVFADRSNGSVVLTAGDGLLGRWVESALSGLESCWIKQSR